MAEFKISGIWKDSNNVITHYAIHIVDKDNISRAEKISKADAITLLESNTNVAITWIWDYKNSGWINGENITIVNGLSGKYLRSNPDNKQTDNLGHLIDFDWIKV
jgi:hypothetical protein